MGDELNPSGGAAGGAGGAGPSGDSPNPNPNPSDKPKMVSWDVHQRMQDDLVKAKRRSQELEAKMGDLESEKLKAANDYKALYEGEQQKRQKVEGELKQFSNWAVQTQRFNAVKSEALAAGLRKEALSDLELIDLESVKVETTSTGRFLTEGAKERVEQLKSERPHWFTVGAPPTVNAGGASAPPPPGQGKLTVNDVVQAERDAKRGKITQARYQEIYKQYAKENPRNAQSGQLPPGRGG